MSRIKVDTAVNKTATGPVDFPSGITGVAATFTGNVTVGGTITYDDVQNVDSVGVVTAGKGLRVTAEGIVVTAGIATLSGGANLGGANITFGDSGTVNDDRLVFGASSDLSIYHDGSNSYINESGTGDLYIRGGTSVRITDLSDNKMFLGQDGGEAQLYYDGLQKLATKTDGAEVSGILTATSLSGRHGNIEAVTKSTGYTLVSGDEGKMIITDSDVTVPENIFAAGDVFTVVNSSGSTINITKGTGINLYTIGSSTNATTTLAEKGIAIITCFAGNDFIVGGGGVG